MTETMEAMCKFVLANYPGDPIIESEAFKMIAPTEDTEEDISRGEKKAIRKN